MSTTEFKKKDLYVYEKIMVDNLKLFNSNEFGGMRTYCDPNTGDVWFNLNDICRALEIKNPSDAKTTLTSKGITTLNVRELGGTLGTTEGTPLKDLGGNPNMTFIDEGNLYQVIFQSRKPNAAKFKEWVCYEVLPSIRKHGAYMTSETIEDILKNPDLIIGMATELKTEQEARKKLQAEAKVNEPKVKFANALMSSESSILVNQMASILTQNGHKIGQNRLFEWLRKNDYLHENTESRNLPKQKWIEKGYFEIKTSVYFDNKAMALKTKSTPKITMKGVEHILSVFDNETVPQVEEQF